MGLVITCTIMIRVRLLLSWIMGKMVMNSGFRLLLTVQILVKRSWLVISDVWGIISNNVICSRPHSVGMEAPLSEKETVGQISHLLPWDGLFRKNLL